MSFNVKISHNFGAREIKAEFAVPGGLTALVGPSGVGKTTILNMIAGLLVPDDGFVALGDRILTDTQSKTFIKPENREIGVVFQDGRLFPHLRVQANLLYGARGAAEAGFEETIALLGLGKILDRWPDTLSGGEVQRVAIGRALLSHPKALLMDEPLASVDAPRKSEIYNIIKALRDRSKVPILYVSHDRAEVAALATHIVEI